MRIPTVKEKRANEIAERIERVRELATNEILRAQFDALIDLDEYDRPTAQKHRTGKRTLERKRTMLIQRMIGGDIARAERLASAALRQTNSTAAALRFVRMWEPTR